MAKVISVLSGKGGVGKSTFCANVGKELSKSKNVLLIDGDVSFRSLDTLLGLDSMVVFDWSDVAFDRCSREKARLFASEKLHLLAAPTVFLENFEKDNFLKLIGDYNDLYDYIIIDSPAGINKYTDIYTSISDENIIVATPDNVSLRAAYTTGERLRSNGIPDKKMRLVLNKVNIRQIKRGNQKNFDDAVDKTYLRLLGVIPEDKAIIYAPNTGIFSLSESTSRSFFDIAERISGKDIKLCI